MKMFHLDSNMNKINVEATREATMAAINTIPSKPERTACFLLVARKEDLERFFKEDKPMWLSWCRSYHVNPRGEAGFITLGQWLDEQVR